MSGNLTTIPPMTHPYGKCWDQPATDRILIDDEVAMMDAKTFEALPEYSTTTPSGVYPGKCWKACRGAVWYLRWYGADDGDPRGLPTPTRKIVIV